MTSEKTNVSDPPTMREHEVLTYSRVKSRLHRLRGGMEIQMQGPLIKALDRLSCIPFVSFRTEMRWDSKIVIAGEEAGTLGEPDIDVILKYSKPSPFGKGEETVMDETYRRGREISGADITFTADDRFSDYDRFLSGIESVVSAALFVPRDVTVKLYKLAIYREGGHFDWHRDTTHSDHHHATVLVALNTSWTGGDFILRCNGIEKRMGMKPKVIPPQGRWDKKPTTEFGVVAFYTDTEHRVEPVTEGVRIVLQYDVEVVGWSDKKGKKDQEAGKKRKATEDEDEGEDEDGNADKKRKTEHGEEDQAEGTKPKGDGADEDGDMKDETEDEVNSDNQSNSDNMEDDPYESKLEGIHEFYRKRKAHQKPSQIGDPAVVDDVIDIVGGLLTGEREEVAFSLQYLYRKSSILPQYLKGSDSLLYQALSKTFDVSLHPIVLEETSDCDGGYGTMGSTFCAYKFDQGAGDDMSDDDDDEVEEEEVEEEEVKHDEVKHNPVNDEKEPPIFFVSRSSAIERISHQSYIEHTGNEAMLGEDKYFGGGMFVRRKM